MQEFGWDVRGPIVAGCSLQGNESAHDNMQTTRCDA